MQQIADEVVCVLGLGYVGLTLATVLADSGFHVLGIEVREQLVRDLQDRKFHFFEEGLARRLVRNMEVARFRPYVAIPEKCPATTYIITVGTPLDADGNVRLDLIERASREVAAHLKSGNMVILRSTSRISTTRATVKPILDAAGVPYELAFCPERTSEGQALAELASLPQIIGADSISARQRAARLFNQITATVVHVSTYEAAELIKLIDNSYRDTMFAFANDVARICDTIGLDAMEIISAANLGYPRTNVLLPGPVGGPCLEKDPHILVESVKRHGIVPHLIATGRRINEAQPLETAEIMYQCSMKLPGFAANPRIAILGLAFKGRPETDDLRGTMARPILESLRTKFPTAYFVGYDPVARPEAIRNELGIEVVSQIADAFVDASVVVVANNHPSFAKMNVEEFAKTMRAPGFIYDYWNLWKPSELNLPDDVRYITLGGLIRFSAKQRPSSEKAV